MAKATVGPPIPPFTHRPNWVVLGTVGLAMTGAAAAWGGASGLRHVLILVGVAFVLLAAVGFWRDWHFPFTRERSRSPGLVDRKRAKAQAAVVQKMVDEQLKVGQEKANNEKMKVKFWESHHGMLMRGGAALQLHFFVWAEPPIFTDSSMLVDFPGSCVVRRGGEEFRSGTVECGGQRGYVQSFPSDFTPQLEGIAGHYEVEWTLPDSRLASRDSFTLNENAEPQ
jgi:hypothetical protein